MHQLGLTVRTLLQQFRERYLFFSLTGITLSVFLLVWILQHELDNEPGIEYFYIDQRGNKILDGMGYFGTSFSEGLAVVCDSYHIHSSTHTFRYIDKYGKTVIKINAIEAQPFSEGLAMVRIEAKEPYGSLVGYIDRKGNWAIPPMFKGGWPFINGMAFLVPFSGERHYIDKSGKAVPESLSPTELIYGAFSEGFASATNSQSSFYINKSGQPAFNQVNVRPGDGQAHALEGIQAARDFSEGLAAVEIHSKWGYVDKNFNIAVKPQFEQAFEFSQGLARVRLHGKIGYISKDGKFLIPPRYAFGGDFSGGAAMVIPLQGTEESPPFAQNEFYLWGEPYEKNFAKRRDLTWYLKPLND